MALEQDYLSWENFEEELKVWGHRGHLVVPIRQVALQLGLNPFDPFQVLRLQLLEALDFERFHIVDDEVAVRQGGAAHQDVNQGPKSDALKRPPVNRSQPTRRYVFAAAGLIDLSPSENRLVMLKVCCGAQDIQNGTKMLMAAAKGHYRDLGKSVIYVMAGEGPVCNFQ